MLHAIIFGALSLSPMAQEKKLPVPVGEELKAAEGVIAGVFQKEYASADRATRRVAGRRLMAEASGTRDPHQRYVVLRDAAKLGAEGVDLGTVVNALDVLTTDFETAPVDAYAAAIATAKKTQPLSREDIVAIAEMCLSAWEKATSIHEHKSAAKFAAQAVELVKKAQPPDASLVQAAEDMAKDSEEAGKMMDRAWGAATVLSKGASDPKACLDLGLYHGAARDDWQKALEFLAKCSVPSIAEVSRLDAANSSDPEARLKVGEMWAVLAAKERAGILKRAYEARSRYWKESAFRVAVGLARTNISRKISAGFVVVKAYYGIGVGKGADVTRLVAEAVDRDPWTPIRAGDEITGNQTSTIETLTVDYMWNGQKGRESAQEGEVVVLVGAAGKPHIGAAASRKFRVLSVHYGTGAKFVDVTASTSYVTNPYGDFRALDFGMDPHPGVMKTAVLQYEWHGRRFVRSAKEGETISVSP